MSGAFNQTGCGCCGSPVDCNGCTYLTTSRLKDFYIRNESTVVDDCDDYNSAAHCPAEFDSSLEIIATGDFIWFAAGVGETTGWCAAWCGVVEAYPIFGETKYLKVVVGKIYGIYEYRSSGYYDTQAEAEAVDCMDALATGYLGINGAGVGGCTVDWNEHLCTSGLCSEWWSSFNISNCDCP